MGFGGCRWHPNGWLPEASENPLDTQLQTAAADNYASDEKLSTSSQAAAPLLGVAGRIDIVWDSQIDIVDILLDCHALIRFQVRYHRSFGA
jgi:hypothetical protein